MGSERSGLAHTQRRLLWLNLVILIAFGVIALAAAYWALVRGPTILERSDNPRLVEAELKIHRGSILDVNSRPLATTSDFDGDLGREYPLPAAAPAVGYYSLRYGTAGMEEAYDAYLRGESDDFWTNYWHIDTLGEAQHGRDLRLTIDSRWQEEASALLGNRSGAALLLSLPDVAIRAMASSPGYDPNSLDTDFERLVEDQEAPLLNRVTQGQYQPGLLLQPFLLAVAQKEGIIDLQDVANGANSEVVVEGVSLACQAAEGDGEMSWAEALSGRCPGPMITLGQRLGGTNLFAALDAFGLTAKPDLPIATHDVEEATITDEGLAAIGQNDLSVSPLQIGVALAALANDGLLRPAQLLAASQDDEGQWMAAEIEDPSGEAVPARVADEILEAFQQNDGLLEHEVIVLSGPEGELNSWYLGLAPAADPRYGAVVVVEDDNGQETASTVGRALLKSALNPEQS